MSDLDKLIRFILDHPELIDQLEEIALFVETQIPDPGYNSECA